MDKLEEEFHEIALKEVFSNDIHPGVMAKALVETNGNKEAAVLKYMSLRAGQLMDEQKKSIIERRKKEDDERIKQFSAAFTDWVIFVGKGIIGGFVIIIISLIIIILLKDYVSEDVQNIYGVGMIIITLIGLTVCLIASIVGRKRKTLNNDIK